jgi:hypothetical protein
MSKLPRGWSMTEEKPVSTMLVAGQGRGIIFLLFEKQAL